MFNWDLWGLQQGQGINNQFNPWMQQFIQSAHDDWRQGGNQYGITRVDDFNTWAQGMVDRWHQMTPEQKWVTSLFNAQNGLTGWGNAQQHWQQYGADPAFTGGRVFPGGERETANPPPDPTGQQQQLPRGAGNTEQGRQDYLGDPATQQYRAAVRAWVQGGRKGPMPTHPNAAVTEPGGGGGGNGGAEDGTKNATQPGGGGRYMTGGAGGGVRGHWTSGPPGPRADGAGTPQLGGVMTKPKTPNVTDAGSLTANSQPQLGGVMPRGGSELGGVMPKPTPGMGGVMPKKKKNTLRYRMGG